MVTQADKKEVAQEAASPPTVRDALALLAAAIRRDLTGGEPLDALEVTYGFAGRSGTLPVSFADANAGDEEDAGTTRTQGRILAALSASDIGLTRKQLATRLGLKNAKGRFSSVVSTLLETGSIVESDGELSVATSLSGDEG